MYYIGAWYKTAQAKGFNPNRQLTIHSLSGMRERVARAKVRKLMNSVTESQSHRLAEVDKDLCVHLVQLLLKQGTPRAKFRGPCPSVF